jgi:membrane protease subunit (stomatin/prohibitin family)
MDGDNVVFLELLEWFDETGREIVHRLPESGSGEIKWGAQLIVRESQAAVMFYKGRALDAFGPGRHTLETGNIPILTKILSIPWGMKSPLRAEVYFVSMKQFPNMKWGTRDPVAFRDSELGLIRLRAFGVSAIQVMQPVLFINTLVGTQGVYTTEAIGEYLSSIIVSRFNDYLGEKLDTVLNLPGRYDEIAQGLTDQLRDDFGRLGLSLPALYINSITPPQDVQKAIDDKSRLGVFDDLNKLLRLKAAMALEKASEAQGEAGAGFGMGMGLMMPALFGSVMAGRGPVEPPEVGPACPDCKRAVPGDARFCPFCGHQIVIFRRCDGCGKNLPPNAQFCHLCGRKVTEKPPPEACPVCGRENLPGALFCNHCGGKIGNV